MIEIVIPTYNRKNYLESCISSILNQKNKQDFFSILVVDNSSTDGTEKYMKNIVSNNIRYIKNSENIGIENNIIKCFKYSKADYVMLMGDDDLLYNSAAEVLSKMLQDNAKLSVILSSADVFINNVENTIRSFFKLKDLPSVFISEASEESCRRFLLRGTLGSGIIFKRNLFDFDGLSKHLGSLYPQMYLLGKSMFYGKTLFLNEPFLSVRDENKKNWEYTGDYMNESIMEIIRDICKQGDFDKKTQNYLVKQRLNVCHNFLLSSKRKSLKTFLYVFYSHIFIREYRYSFRFWFFSIVILILGEKFTFFIGKKIKNYIS